MSFILDSLRRIDAQLDRLQLAGLSSDPFPTQSRASTFSTGDSGDGPAIPSARLLALRASVRSMSLTGSTDGKALLKPGRIRAALEVFESSVAAKDAGASGAEENAEKGTAKEDDGDKDAQERELEWLVVSKATALTYGLVVQSILDQTVGLADDVWYWDEVVGSRRWTAVYSLQTSPLRLWHFAGEVWDDVKARGGDLSLRRAGRDAQDSVSKRWADFYALVRQVVRERSGAEVRMQALAPVTRIRGEMRRNQAALKKVRKRNANALGVLLGEGLANESAHGEGLVASSEQAAQQKWKASVARNVALIGAVLAKVNDEDVSVDKFDAAIAELTEDDPLCAGNGYHARGSDSPPVPPRTVAERLNKVLTVELRQYRESTDAAKRVHGKPSWIIRYWPAVTVGVLSSSTILRIAVNRQAQIIQWIRDLGATTIDFWRNWVVEPMTKVIKTIRHDEDGQLSIVSKRSLEGDRDSLERMVVEFAVDNPQNATGSKTKLSETQIADIRARVKEGDLTPVLKAYERDLRSPFMGTVRGDLIRALLIQVQKTKVDVEVAIGGIDALLKSQELVFGFVGLTPGILVTYALLRWARSSLTEKRGSRAAAKQGVMVRQLRNLDRILTNSHPTEFGELYYKDQGLLLCEAHVLRQEAERGMPANVFKEFAEDVEELCDVRAGTQRQAKVVERIRWAYVKYF